MRCLWFTAAAVALPLASFSLVSALPTPDSGNNATDPCANILKHSVAVGNTSYIVFTPEVAIRCLNSFNITADTRRNQVDILKSYYNLYPFLDLAKDARPPLFPSKIDIMATLDSIAADDTLTTELAFQTAMSKATGSINDAHMPYVPTCFSKFAAMLPFVFTYQPDPVPGNPPKIVVKDSFTSGSALFQTAGLPAADLAKALDRFWIHGLRGASASEFAGFTVQEINGLDPVKTLITADMPNVLRMTLINPSTGNSSQIHAPWAVITTSAASLVSADNYYNSFCTPPKSAVAKSLDKGPSTEPLVGITEVSGILPQELLQPDEIFIAGETRRVRKAGDGSVTESPSSNPPAALQLLNGIPTAVDLNKPLISDPDGAFYMLNGSTGVWVLATFNPSNQSQAGVDNWITTITSGLTALEQAGATKLVIDVTMNGGGDICLGLAIAQYLFSNTTIKPVIYDVRHTQVLEELFRTTLNSVLSPSGSYFALTGMFKLDGSQMETVEDLLVPGVEAVRGGVAGNYSNKFSLDCSSEIKPYILNASLFSQLKKGWDGDHIAITSNGRTLRANYGVKSFTYGGPTGKAFQPTSFEGGESANCLAILSDVERGFSATRYNTTLPRDAFPRPFVLPVTAGIAYWEAYSQFETTGLPVEFEPFVADTHLGGVDGTDPVAVWMAAAAALGG
ncbi:hypothetical protein DFJ73DRAFT_922490 [Zopfochytrium polystomum]|nr:hypothetical protein DFJ73DRAFT_922490 [Zopfochytrium polystomum]